jgi:hypothetical protein
MARSYRSLAAIPTEWPVPTDSATAAANASGLLTPQQRAQILAAVTASGPQAVVRAVQLVIGLLFAGAFLACNATWLSLVLPGALRTILDGQLDQASLIFVGIALVIALVCLLIFLSVFVPPLRRGLWRRRVRREAERGLVAQADGEVRATRSGYVARIDGRRLASVMGERAVLLAPGAYRFYFLPASRALVSAEPRPGLGVLAPGPGATGPGLAMSGPVSTPFAPNVPSQAALLAALAQALRFSAEDLALNRQGRISEAQRRRLIGWTAFLIVFGLVLCVAAPAILIVMFSSWQATCPVLICVLIGGVVLYGAHLSRRDMASGAVAVLRGPVQRTKWSDGEGGTSYYYAIGTMRFSVRRAAFDALIPGLPYAVYYSPRSHKLLSIEPLNPAPTVPAQPI